MNKKNVYTLVAILIALSVYGYEHFLSEAEAAEIVETGTKTKVGAKTFYLPTSTTGQIVHHQGYSLSYSEPHEQAEWIAYEL